MRRDVRRGRRVFEFNDARRTLPLVKRILADALEARRETLRLRKASPSGGVALAEKCEAAAALIAEGRKLGVDILDGPAGAAGFPTIVNGSLAYFIYRHEDDDIYAWRYRDQPTLRPIPGSWYDPPLVRDEVE
ncbi:MAG TPA: DUF2203 family protein [Planctomycetia bacterium]|nr:DUF2203 family protein [Planctomycetia bacterium]